jgi:glutamate--cysteine ligase
MIAQKSLITHLKTHSNTISCWLAEKEAQAQMPFYSSVDIRDAGFKIAAVDTNLFPAGFNNLCQPYHTRVLEIIQNTITKVVPNCSSILLVTEEHTRNTWYLENVRILSTMLEKSGFTIKIAAFLGEDDEICQQSKSIELETATHNIIRVHCLKNALTIGQYDAIILNNDLTDGIPPLLQNVQIPILPSPQGGWFQRLKSHHFTKANMLIEELSHLINIDPWQLMCLFSISNDVNITIEEDRQHLYTLATQLFKDIQAKYDQYHITEKPLIFLKADQGTYGMGVMAIESPEDILNLNRKDRNKLNKGKGSKLITKYILQEGVPSNRTVNGYSSEACIYQINNQFIGGFDRVNTEKNNRENLNSKGMMFTPICLPEPTQTQSTEELTIECYQLIARIAGIAAQLEVSDLEIQSLLNKTSTGVAPYA